MTLLSKFFNYLLFFCYAFLSFSCSSDSEDKSKSFAGTRFKVVLSRSADAKEWVPTIGTQEWWFFSGGVFRQISSDYIEPQFFGKNQACNGSGSGSYEIQQIETRLINVSIKYDGVNQVSGLCRMNDRTFNVTLQPSTAVDMLDNKVVQRLERMENL